MLWIVALPAWGGWYVDVCARWTIPALRAAIGVLPPGHQFVFQVYTDAADRLGPLLSGLGTVEVRDVRNAHRPFEAFAETHRRTLADAPVGSNVVPLNADLVVSVEFFRFAAQKIEAGYQAITTLATRTLPRGEVPVGADGRTLAQWCWNNRHPIADDCIWRVGHTMFPSVVFFRNAEHVVQHAFYQTPFVLRIDGRPLPFSNSSDDDLLDVFGEHEIYVVQDNEVALAEVSPATKSMGRVNHVVDVESVAVWAATRVRVGRLSERNLWLASHKLAVAGDKACVNDRAFYDALARMRDITRAREVA